MADRRQSFSFRFWPARRAPSPQRPAARPSTVSQPVPRQSTTATTAPPTTETQTLPLPTTTISAPATIPAAQSPPITTSTTPPKAQTPPPPATTNSTSPPATESKTPPTIESQTPPPATTNSSPISTPTPEKSQSISRQSTTTATPLPPTKTVSNPPQNPISPRKPTLDPKTPPPVEKQTSSQPTTTSPKDDPKTSWPSTPTTKSPALSNPVASPSRRTTQSRSPPTPSSPSRPSPQAQPVKSSSLSRNSKTPSTPQRASQPRSPSRLTSNQTPLNSPSKESRQIAQTLASNEEGSKPATTTQQEPRINETNSELKAKPKETKDVKEVTEATKINEANEETKKEVNGFLNLKSGPDGPIIEKSEIPNKSDEAHTEKQKEVIEKEKILHTKKRSMNPNDKSSPSINKGIKEDISTFVNETGIKDHTTNERNVSIITLAGENRGASMQMGPTSKEGPVHIHRGYKKVNPDENGKLKTTDEEGNFKGERPKDAKATEDQPTEAYVNNNAQGINNSIVFNASIAERDPGVHMVVTHVQREPISLAEKKLSPLETRKAEFNMSRSEKLTYEEPTVRRRCLRGLFLETSDSDPENSEKPRRHGCRVGCKLKEKENSIDVL